MIWPWVALARGRGYAGVLSACVASGIWLFYEWRLRSLAPVGDPLIRIDLVLIYPLLIGVWITAIATAAIQYLRGRQKTNVA